MADDVIVYPAHGPGSACGKNIGKEIDLRLRFPINKHVSSNLGYAHFWAGDFTKHNAALADPNRRQNSDFFYAEFSISAF